MYEGSRDSVFRAELSVDVISIYGIGCYASYSHVHEFLLHANTVLQTYTLVERLEREVFDERYAVYLYVIDLRTELHRFRFLTSYDEMYIMTVNADNAVTDLPAPQTFTSPVQEPF